jgi:xylulokinase
LGKFAPIEVSDASGMNLTNIITGEWDDKLLNICGGSELRLKLGPEPAIGGVNLGKVSDWWVKRWGVNSGKYRRPSGGVVIDAGFSQNVSSHRSPVTTRPP